MPIYDYAGKTPSLGQNVFVAPNATLIGDLVIGDDSSIWFGTVIRGDVFPIRIGARTNVQDNSVIHVTNGKAKTTIGDDVTIGHAAIIHGATIGNRCLVGMGSIILDDAELEPESFVAAGAVVPPWMKVATRTLVAGNPARVVRKLEEADIAKIREAAELYVQYAKNYGDLK